MSEKIKVLLVDDHEMVRSGLKVFLEAVEEFDLVGEAASGQQAIDLCDKNPPDVILMDLMLPDMTGVEATQMIKEKHPETEIIILTSLDDERFVKKALQAGAIGYLLKNVSVDDLAAAIISASIGEPYLAPEATKALISSATKSDYDFNLTPREKEVLREMIHGLSNPSIANRLHVSRSTIKTHVSNILRKLNVSSRVKAVALAIENRILDQ